MKTADEIKVLNNNTGEYEVREILPRDDDYWKPKLLPEEFNIMRKKGTEPSFRNEFFANKKTGLYVCRGCGNHLFDSKSKYDSGSGWPSFTVPVAPENVIESEDDSFGMIRTEVHCPVCGAHLGHVFNDGPGPEGLRYCMNSASMKFEEK